MDFISPTRSKRSGRRTPAPDAMLARLKATPQEWTRAWHQALDNEEEAPAMAASLALTKYYQATGSAGPVSF